MLTFNWWMLNGSRQNLFFCQVCTVFDCLHVEINFFCREIVPPPPRSSLQTVVYTPSDMIPSSCLFISFRTCFALSCICPLCSNVYRDTILLYADHGPEEMINPPAVYTITMRNAFTAFIYDMLIVLAFLPQGLFFKVFQCFWRRNSRVHIN